MTPLLLRRMVQAALKKLAKAREKSAKELKKQVRARHMMPTEGNVPLSAVVHQPKIHGFVPRFDPGTAEGGHQTRIFPVDFSAGVRQL